MSGIGDVMLEHLTKVATATSEELWKVAGGDYQVASSRLKALRKEERVVWLSGIGRERVWTLEGAKVPFVPLAQRQIAPKSSAFGFGSNLGWKPDLSRFEPLDGPLAKGDKLLVEYPERWRNSMLCSVTRPSGYFGVEGHAQVWNLRDNCYSIVDAAGWRERGWKVARLTLKQVASLLEARHVVELDAES